VPCGFSAGGIRPGEPGPTVRCCWSQIGNVARWQCGITRIVGELRDRVADHEVDEVVISTMRFRHGADDVAVGRHAEPRESPHLKVARLPDPPIEPLHAIRR
jgi:hypothetical protein